MVTETSMQRMPHKGIQQPTPQPQRLRKINIHISLRTCSAGTRATCVPWCVIPPPLGVLLWKPLWRSAHHMHRQFHGQSLTAVPAWRKVRYMYTYSFGQLLVGFHVILKVFLEVLIGCRNDCSHTCTCISSLKLHNLCILSQEIAHKIPDPLSKGCIWCGC